MSSHTEFQLQIMFQTLDTDPTTQNKVFVPHTTKSLNRDNIKLLISVR